MLADLSALYFYLFKSPYLGLYKAIGESGIAGGSGTGGGCTEEEVVDWEALNLKLPPI